MHLPLDGVHRLKRRHVLQLSLLEDNARDDCAAEDNDDAFSVTLDAEAEDAAANAACARVTAELSYGYISSYAFLLQAVGCCVICTLYLIKNVKFPFRRTAVTVHMKTRA